MCFRKCKAEYPLTDKQLTIHGRVYDTLLETEATFRSYTNGGKVSIIYCDGLTWCNLVETKIANDGLFMVTVPLGYGTYRLFFEIEGRFRGGRFAPLCYNSAFIEDDSSYTFRLSPEDIIQQAKAPQTTGDICVFVAASLKLSKEDGT